MGRISAKRACDRCHSIKEKCRRISDHSSCERCQRLGSQCQTQRPLRRAGRRPWYRRADNTTEACNTEPSFELNPNNPSTSSPKRFVSKSNLFSPVEEELKSMPRALSLFPDMDERELQLLHSMCQGQIHIDQFLIAPSFRACHYESFARHLFSATTWLQDALVATAALIACEHDVNSLHQDRVIGYKRAASTVLTLRSITTFEFEDLSTVLVLAISAVTVALHISGHALAICRHSLNIIKPLYEGSTKLDSDCSAFVICLIHSEIVECLLHGQIPTLKFRVQNPDFVDRFLGVASPLLPYFYEVCEISKGLRDQENCLNIMETLFAVNTAIEQWCPVLPANYDTLFQPDEVLGLLTQAKVHRWTLLLLLLRLRHPYGTETTKATEISNAILKELESTIRLSKRSVPCISLAFLVACCELTDRQDREKALGKSVTIIQFCRQTQIGIAVQLKTFWSVIDTSDQLRWCDVLPSLPLDGVYGKT